MRFVFVFLEMVFGFFIFVRLLDQIRIQKLVGMKTFVVLIAAFLVWCLIWSLIPGVTILKMSFLVWLPMIFLFLLPNWIIRRHRNQFRAEFLIVLSHAIMKLNNGTALRPAFLDSCSHISNFSKLKIIKIIENLNFDSTVLGDETDFLARYLIEFLKRVEKDTHLSIPRLNHLKHKFQTEIRFQSRKNRALLPVQSQIVVLSVLYLLALFYVVGTQQGYEYIKFVTASSVLFLVGAFIALGLSRSFKWRV